MTDWRKEVANANPVYGSEIDSSPCCIFCHADTPAHDKPETHEPDCLWRRAVTQSGLKSDDVQRLGPCAVCGKALGEEGKVGPTFYVLDIRRETWSPAGFVANAFFGKDENLSITLEGPREVVIHENCAMNIPHLLDLMPIRHVAGVVKK